MEGVPLPPPSFHIYFQQLKSDCCLMSATSSSLAVGRDTIIRWIQRGVLRVFRFPAPSKKRERKYDSYRISESERQRFIRSWMIF